MKSETVKSWVTYPLASYDPRAIRRSRLQPGEYLRAKWTCDPPRPPKKGEWYLSGAVIEAHQAKEDMDQPHYIAYLVVTELQHVVVREL